MKTQQIMTRLLTIAVLAATIATMPACAQKGKKGKSGKVELLTEVDTVSYIIGNTVARNIKAQGMDDLNFEAYVQGVRDQLEDEYSIVEIQAGEMMVNNYFRKMAEEVSNKKLAEADQFLAENKNKEGVITTESGRKNR
jgi:FKBP-type peptidyl-prolyl cis-trans isomerase FklB